MKSLILIAMLGLAGCRIRSVSLGTTLDAETGRPATYNASILIDIER